MSSYHRATFDAFLESGKRVFLKVSHKFFMSQNPINTNEMNGNTNYCSSCEADYDRFSNGEVEYFIPCYNCSDRNGTITVQNNKTALAAVLESGKPEFFSSSHSNLMSQNPIINNEMNANEIAAQQQFPAMAEYQAKKSLVAAIEGIFERIEILSADERINEGEYLQFAELVKDMYAFRQSVRTNTIYVEIARQSRAREPTAPKSDREKLTDQNSRVCNRCDKPVHKHYLASGEHHRTATCIRAFQNKLNVKAHKAVHNGRYAHLQVLNLDLVAKVDAGRYGEGSFLRRVVEFSPLQRRTGQMGVSAVEDAKIRELTSSELNYHKIDGRWTIMPDDYEPPVKIGGGSGAVVPQPNETEEEKTERLRLRRNQLSRESKARARDRRRALAQGTDAADADDAVLEEIFGVAEVADEVFGVAELFDEDNNSIVSDDAERKRLRRNQLSRESKARARARAKQLGGGGQPTTEVVEEVEECMTCLQAYTFDRRIKLSAPCGHHCCIPCWKGLKRHSDGEVCPCPMCRADITQWIYNSV